MAAQEKGETIGSIHIERSFYNWRPEMPQLEVEMEKNRYFLWYYEVLEKEQ